MTVNMAGKLPDGDTNGLGRILSKLINQPDEVHVGVVLFDCSKTTTNNDTGDITPTVRIRAIEVALPGADTAEAQRLLRRAHSERTGDMQLPLDLEQAIDSWLLRVDPADASPAGDVVDAVIHESDCPGGACECGVDTATGEAPPPDGDDVVVPDDASELDDMPTGPDWGDVVDAEILDDPEDEDGQP